MTHSLLTMLAQIDPSKLNSEARLEVAASPMWTWLISGAFAVGILLIAFKTSKRNATDRD